MTMENAIEIKMDILEMWADETKHPKKIVVHGGVFHADDVMCVAILRTLFPEIKIERVFKAPEPEEGVIIADIGGGKYDHHQPDARLRKDGCKYAACGLIYEDFGPLLWPDMDSFESFRDRYIIPIENTDNGLEPNPLSSAIHAFNPTWDCSDEEVRNNQFMKAVSMLQGIIQEEMRQAQANAQAKQAVEEAIAAADNGLCVLDEYLPTNLFAGKANFIISPSLRGGYQLLTVKKNNDTMEDMISLPESWLENKPEGCTFVHQGRFIASFNTLEYAIAAAKSIL